MIRRISYIFFVLMLWCPLVSGQTSTATLRGRVRDATGAAVPGATVSVKNNSTGVSVNAITDQSGNYVAPYLLPGQYTLTVEHAGFQKFAQTDISLAVGQQSSLDVALVVGAVNETVTVSEAAPLLDTDSSAVSTTIDNKQVASLPLDGRVALGLAALVPGVIPGGGNAGSSIGAVNGSIYLISYTPWISGTRNATNDVLQDGIPLGLPNTNAGTLTMGISGPTVDALQEFRVFSSTPPAEYGRTGGGVISYASKSGANQIHGSAFEYARNSVLDANNYFNNRAHLARPTFQRNQFGGSFSGPVYIPHIYNGHNRTFFFFDTEITRARSADTLTTTVPLDAWKQGDFSSLKNSSGNPITIYDPTTSTLNSNGRFVRTAFAGNKIPASRMDPVALNLMKYYPEPNAIPTNSYTQLNNWSAAGTDASNSTDFAIRVDHQFNDKLRSFMRYAQGLQSVRQFNFFDSPASPQGRGTENVQRYAFAWSNVYTLNPTTIFELRYGLVRFSEVITPLSYGFRPSTLGFPGYLDAQASKDELRFPYLAVNGITPLGQIGGAGLQFTPTTHNILASVSKIEHRHFIKAGFEYRKLFLNFWSEAQPSGNFSFDSTWTQQSNTASSVQGFGMASLLLGLPTSGGQSDNPHLALASSYFAGYIEDSLRALDRLTFNIGVRYDVDVPKTERHNQLSYFNADVPSPLGAVPGFPNLMGAMEFAKDGARHQVPTDWNNISPRLGFAYSPDKKSLVSGGYAMLYGPSLMQVSNTGTLGYSASTAMIVSQNGATALNYLSNPFPNGFNPQLGATPGPNSGALTSIGLGFNGNYFPSNKSPTIQEWNLTLQRELPGGFVGKIGYVGNKGDHLDQGESYNYSQLPDSAMALGSKLLTLVPNPFYGIITNPNSVLSTPTIQQRYLLGKYPQYADSVSVNNVPLGHSIYHSVIVQLQRRFTNGIGLLISYTGGKLLDDGGFASTLNYANGGSSRQDFFNQRADWSVSTEDISSRFVANFTYELPIGRAKLVGRQMSGVANLIVGGWQFNGIVTVQDGAPVALSQTPNQTGTFTTSQRPNESQKNAGLKNRSIAQWFNTSIFSLAPAYTFGNAPRTLPNVRQPGYQDVDLSLFKDFGLWENAKLSFRIEAFNAFNKTNFGQAGSQFGSSTFGAISSAGAARDLQLAVHLTF
jgi:hypothetical protein